MECPICKREMIDGNIEIYEMGSVLFHKAATMKFVPSDKSKKTVKTVKGGRYQKMQGYCCEKCKKLVAIASIENFV